jgi:tRNA nucleotidyltransferase (CCA-adding enzyme)
MAAFTLRYDPKERYFFVPVSDPRVKLPEPDLADRGEYHITVITPDETHDLLTRKGWKVEKMRADLEGYRFETAPKYVCLGKQEKADNAVYFIVVRWPEAQAFRDRFDLPNQDFHVTLGFRTGDIHDVPKNSSTCIGKIREGDDLSEERLRVTKEIDQIHQAMWGNKVVAIQYMPIDGVSPVARLIEPYSFREMDHGIMLYGWDIQDRRTKSFYADRIRSVRIQSTTFKPRWDVEPDSIRELAEERSGNPFPFASAILDEGRPIKLLEAAGSLRDVIVLDVDGTLVNVDARASSAFHAIGMEVEPGDWEDKMAELDYETKDKFLRLFLSDKYAKMDKPYTDVFDFVKRLVDREDLPVVLLTGRPDTMRHTDSVATMLMHHGIPVSEVIQRPESEARTKTASFKIKMLQQRNYNPKYLLDDDPRNVTEFVKTWPDAVVYRIDNGIVRKVRAAVTTESEQKTDLPIDVPPDVIDVLKAINKEGGLGIVVGGAVRDAILGKVGKDIDIEVYNIPGDKLFSILSAFGKVNAVGKSFGVYKLKIGPLEIDFSLPRRDRKTGTGHRGFDVDVDHTLSYSDAAKRRDFTINTLGYDPLTKTVYDPHGGMDDLKRGVIRMTDPAAFKEDPLRVLRMAQFAARFGFDVDPETVAHAKVAPELETLPKERLFEEFKKALLRAKRPGTFVLSLAQSHALERIVPELHGKDKEVAELLDKVAPSRTGQTDDDLILMFSAIAWATTARFLNGITNEADIIKRVSNVYAALHGLKKKWPESDEDVRRWLHTVQPGNLKIVESLSKVVFGKATEALFTRAEALQGQVAPIVLGRHLQQLGLSPGPVMGKLLKQLHDLQLAGKFSDLDGGLALAQRLMTGMQESTTALLGQLLPLPVPPRA